MALLNIEVKYCYDINCKYLKKEKVYSPDPFEGMYYCAKCLHPQAPIWNGVGSSDEGDYCKIPQWCPLRKDKS